MVEKESKFSSKDRARMGSQHPAIVKADRDSAEEKVREQVNNLRQEILEPLTSNAELKKLEYNRLSTGQEDVAGTGGKRAFQRRWWKFTKEQDGKVPLIERWFYGRMAGTGQFISVGLGISLGPSWGAVVLTLPMFEFTIGYVPSPMTLK